MPQYCMNRKERRSQKNGPKTPADQQKEALIRQALDAAANLFNLGKLAEAEQVYKGILEHDPQNTTAHFNFGTLLQRRGDFSTAEKHFTTILSLNPDDLDAKAALIFVHLDQGKVDEALKNADQLGQKDIPAEAHVRLGNIYREAGKIDQAIAHFEKALSMNERYVGAYYALMPLKKFSLNDKHLERLIEIEKSAESLPLKDQINLKFALGKALGDCGDDAGSFARYADANKLKRNTYSFSIDLFEKYIDAVIRIFDADVVARLKNKGHITDERPVFIVGMPRSGSTLTEQILSSHPGVTGLGEVAFFTSCVPFVPNAEVQGFFKPNEPSITRQLLDLMATELLDAMGQKYISLINPRGGKAERIIDKMLFNFLWIGFIRLALPNARIIDCTRDPVDIGLSIWRLSFTDDIPWAYDLEEIGRYYLAYRKLMAHWHTLFPGEIHEANYEKIVADQENETRKLLAFCGLAWDERCLNFHQADRQVKTASSAQVRKPIYKDSVKKWEKYRAYLRPLVEIFQKAGAI